MSTVLHTSTAVTDDPLLIAGVEYHSRLLVGTGKYKDMDETRAATEASGAEIVTVAIRRTNIGQNKDEPNLLEVLPPSEYTLLPNTAGCYTAEDAIRTCRLARELLDELEAYDWEWGDGFGAIEVGDDDGISLGDTAIHVLETPGHSQCSISAYVPRLKALFPSDGGGIPFRNTIIVYGTSNYGEFQKSLLKLSELEVRFLCADHYGYVVGEEAAHFIGRASGLAAKLRAMIENSYGRLGDVEKVVDELTAVFSEENADGIVSGDLFRATWRSIVKNITVSMHKGK